MALTPEEHNLIQRSIAGDLEALEQILLTYYEPLERYLKRQMTPDVRALLSVEDVIQDTHVQVIRSIKTFTLQEDGDFLAWLRSVAKSRLLDLVKRQRRKKRGGEFRRVHSPAGPPSLDTLVAIVAQDTDTPSQVFSRGEERQAVHVGLACLSDDYREVLRLRYLEGWSVADIARKMNRSEHAVHMLCNRGVKKLKEALQHNRR